MTERGLAFSHPALICPFLGIAKSVCLLFFSLFVSVSSYLSVKRYILFSSSSSCLITFLLAFSTHIPFSFQSAQHFEYPQITVHRRAPLSECSSGCIFHQTTGRPQNHWASSSPVRAPVWIMGGGGHTILFSTHQVVKLSLTTRSSSL